MAFRIRVKGTMPIKKYEGFLDISMRAAHRFCQVLEEADSDFFQTLDVVEIDVRVSGIEHQFTLIAEPADGKIETRIRVRWCQSPDQTPGLVQGEDEVGVIPVNLAEGDPVMHLVGALFEALAFETRWRIRENRQVYAESVKFGDRIKVYCGPRVRLFHDYASRIESPDEIGDVS